MFRYSSFFFAGIDVATAWQPKALQFGTKLMTAHTELIWAVIVSARKSDIWLQDLLGTLIPDINSPLPGLLIQLICWGLLYGSCAVLQHSRLRLSVHVPQCVQFLKLWNFLMHFMQKPCKSLLLLILLLLVRFLAILSTEGTASLKASLVHQFEMSNTKRDQYQHLHELICSGGAKHHPVTRRWQFILTPKCQSGRFFLSLHFLFSIRSQSNSFTEVQILLPGLSRTDNEH